MTLNPFYGTGILQYPLTTSGEFSYVFQEVYKNASAMKWIKDIFNKYISRMLIFMFFL